MWRNAKHYLMPVLTVIVFVLAVWLLFHSLGKYQWVQVRGALRAISGWRLAGVTAIVALNYVVLIGYDWLAIRAIGQKLPFWKVALASFAGHATSYNFGALLGGTSVRYRLYSSWGLSAVEIVQLVTSLAMTFWFGLFALAGVLFLIDPLPIPEYLDLPSGPVKVGLPTGAARHLAVVLLVLTAAYLLAAAFVRRTWVFRGTEVRLPTLRIAASQTAVAAVDMSLIGLSLFLLLPADAEVTFPHFLGVVLLGMILTIITHVPGGVGVMEVVVVTLTPVDRKDGLIAALLAFRVLYYLGPLLTAAALLLIYEGYSRKEATQRVWDRVSRSMIRFTPSFVATGVFIAGLTLLLSGATPMLESRLKLVERWLPLEVFELSHFFGSVVGTILLLFAHGLLRRLDSAYWLTVSALIAGIVVSVAKELALEEATILALALVLLLLTRKSFYRRGSLLHQPFDPAWFTGLSLALGGAVWLGLFAFKHVEFSSTLWWQFGFHSDAPRSLRAAVGVIGVLTIYGVTRLVRPMRVRHELPAAESLAVAARIVAESADAAANLALVGDKVFLFNPDQTGFIMYGVRHRSWIAMGDPVGPEESREDLVWRFREQVDLHDGWPVFYQVETDNLPLYVDLGLTLFKLGEEARVALPEFSLEGSDRKKQRQVVSRLTREGCTLEVLPADQVPAMLPTLRKISDDWLAAKQAREKSFSLGYFHEDYLRQFPCAIVRQGDQPVAFANLWLSAHHEEASIDLMRYSSDAPNSVMEFLFLELMRWSREQGYQWFNLGMAPLSGIHDHRLAPLWNRASSLLFRHGDHFYSFQGLREYKEKFSPQWRPKYLASPSGFALPRILADITALISSRRE